MNGTQIAAADVEWIAQRTARITPEQGNTVAVVFGPDLMEVVEVTPNGDQRASWGASPYGRE